MIQGLLLVVAFSLNTAAVECTQPLQESALHPLRQLDGDWVVLDARGVPTELMANYRSAANGTVVIETMLRDTPEETVTIYHTEGAALTATHLSGRGRPVRLERRDSETARALTFAADGDAARPEQASEVSLTWLEEGGLRVEWLLEDGKNGGRRRTSFDLSRRVPIAKLAAEVSRLRVSLASLQAELDRRLKQEVTVHGKGQRATKLLETRTFPGGPGWTHHGVAMREMEHRGLRFASTFAAEGDGGQAVLHWPFETGTDTQMTFSLLGGHAYVALVEETRSPPRRIRNIEEFSTDLLAGRYGTVLFRVVGERWREYPASIAWDLSEHDDKNLRFYLVDAETNQWGQIACSEVRVTETVK